jgi:hypothetical protein
MFYCRFRRLVFGPGRQPLVDDRGWIGKDASPVRLHWPPDTPKPKVGVIQDYGEAPGRTKYCRFLEGEYRIIEISPLCRIDTCEELKVQGIPGYYVMQGDSYSFQPGRLWVPELALKEFFSREYGIPPDDPGADHRPAGSG